ncbi:MAG: DUF615 domain-containing protein, partial [Pseudomonadales bacterium]|nr:DUF615 domain-containing protein [Pseudomonadales bacterium]
MPDEDDYEDFDDRPSKSQVKREMHAIRDLGERLLDLPADQIEKLGDVELINAINECRRITKGNARKRQIQYIGKLLRKGDVSLAHELLDRFDASSRAHVQHFHKLED